MAEDETPQSKGGKARAENLSPDRKKEIASEAAAARWRKINRDDLPRATHYGERQVAGHAIQLYNLADGRRIISERGFLALIGAKGRGSFNGRRLGRILGDFASKSFFSNKILMAIEKPIQFLTPASLLGFGYQAEILKEFCVGFSKARNGKALKSATQLRYAERCEVLLYAFAELGVIGWIDEATGFQRDRNRDALHAILDAYISKHWASWSKTFPDEFYEHIFRLKGLPYDASKVKRPGFVGRITTDIVYARLARGVLRELENKNPVSEETKRRTRKHHQWLTKDFGHPKLKEHINNVTFLMKGTTTWEGFHRVLERAAPRMNETTPFDLGDDY